MKDIGYASEEVGLDASIISDTRTLRRKIEEEFGEHISFRSASKYVLVYASDTNPCDYAVATLRGQGLRDDDLIRAFGRMIRRKLQCRDEKSRKWPLTAEEFFLELDRGPPPDLYNAIFYTISDDAKKNEYGYNITTSKNLAIKIWSLASDWESLITKKSSPKQEILGKIGIHY